MDEELYKKTLKQYGDPAFAKKYAGRIANQKKDKTLDELLALVPAGGAVLDVACAAGRDSKPILDRGYKVTGIDQSGALLKIANERVPGADFVQDDFTDMPFADDSFDAIWCNAALVHLPSQAAVKQALKELWRVLKPGGTIAINVKARLAGQAATAVKKDALSSEDRYFRYQSEEEFVTLCKQVGFKILKHRVINEKDDPARTIKRDENWLLVIANKPLDS